MKVMEENPSHFKDSHLPMENVSWEDCQEFCRRTSLVLPTASQWEWACRAGRLTPFAFGETITPRQANFDCEPDNAGDNSDRSRRSTWRRTMAVKSFVPNQFGFYNLHGNVMEWCGDEAPATPGFKNLRGGDWSNPVRFCRWDTPCSFPPKTSTNYIGFRPAFYPLP